MQDMDFTRPQPAVSSDAAPYKPAASRYYDPAVARALFGAAGSEERFAPGHVVFGEDEKSRGGLFARRAAPRMYLVVEGEVALTSGGRLLDVAKRGDIFGEMAVIGEQPRSATATARGAVTALALDRAGLEGALGRTPEFALMLMSVMFERLRFLAARLATRKAAAAEAREGAVFDAATLAQFEAALPRAATVRHYQDAVVMREGQAGAFMYVVKEGRVAILIRGTKVESVVPGGTLGEMALVDQSPRTASAVAETECELLQVDRAALLAAVAARPAFALALLRAVGERLRYMNARLN